MKAKQLQETIELLRRLLAELDGGLPDEKWKVQRRLAQSIVRLMRLEATYRKYRREFQDANPNSGERDPTPTALETQLFKEVISVHLAIHRRLKALREAGEASKAT